MARQEDQKDVLFAQIQRRMVEHGEWDRLSWLLNQKLSEAGWLDEYRDKSRETLRTDSVSVGSIMAEVWPQAEASIPAKAKREMIAMIRQYLETQLEG
ncbi:uncharacterized protein LAESUDRAFT_730946 [Laetiporus sulphureus 93-53]|uniref:Transcription and mRNA export factor SUS1 n=1 Tax=Laetiporus sulphureus 93-53 TaxID=1314785 RepID=A0A165BUH0_9APHY|nr:uncharacterized protein LAESUDRAFT_730946 [Laetiporus sulphureus 93-53]KZT01675.1 hypothetical protein LAESUDRAFT_730946 [Laetiporus sulphureus 93-53]